MTTGLICIVGIPGIGKSTQARLLGERASLNTFGMSSTANQYAKEFPDSSLTTRIREVIDPQGNLVSSKLFSDKDVVELVRWKLQYSLKGIVAEGVPRTLNQARELSGCIESALYLDHQNVPFWELEERAHSRGRESAQMFMERLALQEENLKGMLPYLKRESRLYTIDASKGIEEVHAMINACIKCTKYAA